jgi:hypothetical protein
VYGETTVTPTTNPTSSAKTDRLVDTSPVRCWERLELIIRPMGRTVDKKSRKVTHRRVSFQLFFRGPDRKSFPPNFSTCDVRKALGNGSPAG